jgi:uncharacterized damage-inducible protein DinB
VEEIKRIADQLKRAYEGEAWHGPSLRELLNGATAAIAAKKPLANAHSIWEIVLHIAAWEKAVRRRLEGEVVVLPNEEDWPPVNDTSETAWKNALATLENGNKQLHETILRLNDAQLSDIVPGKNYSVYYMLHGVIQHHLYHAGQIAILKKA